MKPVVSAFNAWTWYADPKEKKKSQPEEAQYEEIAGIA
jgi:hypothetical protein